MHSECVCGVCMQHGVESNGRTRHTRTTRLSLYTRSIQAFYREVCVGCYFVLSVWPESRRDKKRKRKKKPFTFYTCHAKRATNYPAREGSSRCTARSFITSKPSSTYRRGVKKKNPIAGLYSTE